MVRGLGGLGKGSKGSSKGSDRSTTPVTIR